MTTPTNSNPAPDQLGGQPVHVAIYEHSHGMDVRVFRDPEQATRWRDRIAQEWWSDAFGEAPPPVDRIGADYFERMADHGEYFSTKTCRIECSDHESAGPVPDIEDEEGGAS